MPLMGLVTLTFESMTLKLVSESHQRWETFVPNLGTLGLWVLELFAMYTTDRRMDKSKAKHTAPFPIGGGITNVYTTADDLEQSLSSDTITDKTRRL